MGNLAISSPAAARGSLSRPMVGGAGLLLALVALCSLPGIASANERQWRVGVIDGSLSPETDVAAMGKAKVEVYRVQFNWERAEPDDVDAGTCPAASAYNWEYYDRLVLQASREGVQLLPVILGSPDYVSSDPRNPPDTRKPEIRNYKCFVRAVVGRYGPRGEFPKQIEPEAEPIREWQVWNEPNLRQYSVNRRISPREYSRLLKVTTAQVRKNHRRATIVMAGLPERPSEGMNGLKFLRKLYRVRRIERKFDVLALHPYAANHRGVEGSLIRLRRVLKRLGDRRRYVWVTEVGWGTHDGTDNRPFLTKSERGQARQLTKTYKLLRRKRNRYNVGTVTWFRWRDTAETSADLGAFHYAGLYRRNGSPKPSCDAFVKFTRARPCRPIPGPPSSAAAASSELEPRRASTAPLPSTPE